ncbi:hypothetical protein BC938DRAFT_480591 [Jimgerdemannia flammicorona]|uniref:Uncharacterized protein n=1 Tax=Jimgerdemannia flammicorona TaxID=994334 RepID=A0A433QX75_9FUNG|nr:hypothetical protein BC938DRAFT_480591 [Jimgerdemannia flammicorona]
MIQILLSTVSWSYSLLLYTLLVVFPALAFDLGGKRTGLALSFDLLLFYMLIGFAAMFCRTGSSRLIPTFLRSIELIVIVASFFHAFRHNTGGARGSYLYAPYEAVLHFCGPLFTLLEARVPYVLPLHDWFRGTCDPGNPAERDSNFAPRRHELCQSHSTHGLHSLTALPLWPHRRQQHLLAMAQRRCLPGALSY